MVLRQMLFTLAGQIRRVTMLATVVGIAALPATATASPPASIVVALFGTVDGPPESVVFSGPVQLEATLIESPGLGTPNSVLLVVDLRQVAGIGAATGKTYVTSTQEILNRQLTVADLFELTFTFFPSGEGRAAARVGMVSFNLGFDTATGQFTGAEAEVVPPNFPENDELAITVPEDVPASSSRVLP